MTEADGRTVMLIEDDAPMMAVLRTLLEMEGYHVATAPEKSDLEQVVTAIRSARPNVILLDVHLRQMNGYEILERLRGDPECAATRVVMSSGMDVGARCLAAGADAFLQKPFMPDELIQKLRGGP